MNVNASLHARIIFTVYHSNDLSYVMFCAARFLPSTDSSAISSVLRVRFVNSLTCPTYKTEALSFHQPCIITANAFRESAGHTHNLITANLSRFITAAVPVPQYLCSFRKPNESMRFGKQEIRIYLWTIEGSV